MKSASQLVSEANRQVETLAADEAIKLMDDDNVVFVDLREPVPVVNQIRTYWWCSPPRIGRPRMCPASSGAREIGASFSKDKCVRISL
jgi:hypothetical protein